jgi:hypothetical protein
MLRREFAMAAFLLLTACALVVVLLWLRGADVFERFFSAASPVKPRHWKSVPLGCEELRARIVPVTRTWTGLGTDNNASTPENWQGNTAPAQGDSLSFAGNTKAAILDSALTPQLGSITIDPTFGASVEVGESVTLSGVLQQAGSVLTVDPGQQLTIGALNLTGGLVQGPGSLEVTGGGGVAASVLGGGVLGANTTFDTSASLAINNKVTFDGSTVTNSGAASWMYGDIWLDNAAQFKNYGTLTISVPSSTRGSLFSDGSATAVYNYGFWQVFGETAISASFSNATAPDSTTGTVIVNSGASMDLLGAGIHSAPFVVNSGGRLEFDEGLQTLQNGTSFQGLGEVRVSGVANDATLSVAQNVTVQISTTLTLSGRGRLSGAGAFNVAGPFAWQGGFLENLNSLTLTGSTQMTGGDNKKILNSNLTNLGTITWTGTGDIGYNRGSIINYGTFDIQNDQSIAPAVAGAPFQFHNGLNGQNRGVVKKTAGEGATTIVAAFYNDGGDLLLNGFNLSFQGGFQQTSTSSTTDLGGGNLQMTGGFTFMLDGGRLTGGGKLYGSLGFLNGTLDMGTAFGGLTIMGNYTQTGGTLNLKTGPNESDVLDVYGSASLGGTSALQVSWTGAGNPFGTYYILYYGLGVTGAFSEVLPAGTWTVNYQAELMTVSAQ